MLEKIKKKILKILEKVYLCDFCIMGIANKIRVSRITVARYAGELKGERRDGSK